MASRIKYFDSLRGIAIIAVVFIHALSYGESTLGLSIFFRQSINFAVPLFLAISGYFLVNKKIDNKVDYFFFLKKQIVRVYLPYLIWSCIFALIYVYILKAYHFSQILRMILLFQTVPIFYYVALIIQYYILFPFFKLNLRVWLISSIIISLSIAVLLALFKYYYQISLPLIIYAGNFLTWLVFFILGMYLGQNKMKINIVFLILLSLFFLILSNFETYYYIYLFNNVGHAVSAVKVTSFIYSGFLIVLLLNFQKNWTVFSDLGKVSYAIFLMHMLILPVVRKLTSKLYWSDGILIDLFCGIVTIIVSYLICLILRKISPNFSQKYLGV